MKLTIRITPPPTTPPVETPTLNLYRTLHPFAATHDGFDWPARPANYAIPPNSGSFDVYCRYWKLPNAHSDGGAIVLTAQQWGAIQRKNTAPRFVQWAVGTTAKIMMWKDGESLPVFHYPLCFGGNIVNVLERSWPFARVETWPAGKDVPDNLPPYLWMRTWCVYNAVAGKEIRDAPAGENSYAYPCYMLALAHGDSAWIYGAGLLKYI